MGFLSQNRASPYTDSDTFLRLHKGSGIEVFCIENSIPLDRVFNFYEIMPNDHNDPVLNKLLHLSSTGGRIYAVYDSESLGEIDAVEKIKPIGELSGNAVVLIDTRAKKKSRLPIWMRMSLQKMCIDKSQPSGCFDISMIDKSKTHCAILAYDENDDIEIISMIRPSPNYIEGKIAIFPVFITDLTDEFLDISNVCIVRESIMLDVDSSSFRTIYTYSKIESFVEKIYGSN